MAHWMIPIAAERYEAERLFHHDTVELPRVPGPVVGDGVALVAEDLVVALGRVEPFHLEDADDPEDLAAPEDEPGPLVVRYTHRLFDAPIDVPPSVDVPATGAVPLAEAAWVDLLGRARPYAVDAPRRDWLVSVDLPIEATSPAEAVRTFWSYVMHLGPRELPAFVSPADDELAMVAYVLGDEATLDPEDEGDD